MLLKSLDFKADSVDMDERTFEGYASTWDRDQGGDIIVPGAFAKTIQERGNRVKVLWQHYDPIGRALSLKENSVGLFVKGKVSKTRQGDEALELMRDLVIDQMSIGYSIPEGKSHYDDQTNTRTIKEVKLLEFSPVTFPMNEAAVITGVKSFRDAMNQKRDLNAHDLKELADMVVELNALIKGEPRKRTSPENQPQELADLQKAIQSWGV